MDKKFKRGSIILLILLLGLFSILSVNALLVTMQNQWVISIHNVNGLPSTGVPADGYGAGTWNLTNTTSSRPYINFNVTMFNGSTATANNNSANVTLYVWPVGGGILLQNSFNNETVARNNTLTTIYFNQTLNDGYYTWRLNATNWSLGNAVFYNQSNATDYYALIIDTTAPNVSYNDLAMNNVYSQSAQRLFINVSSNDTNYANAQVGGGFVGVYLRNESGLLNFTVRPRDVFAANLLTTLNITFSYGTIFVFTDGRYFFNASINDSLGNTAWLGDKEILVDTANPSTSITSSAGSTMNRLATTTIKCNVLDLYPANLSMSFSVGGDDTKGVSCSGTTNSSSCEFEFTPTIAETKEITCRAYDRTARTTVGTFGLEVTSDASGSGGGSGGGSGSSGGGGQSPIEVTTVPVVANEPFTYDVGNTYIGVDSVTLTSSSSKDVKLTVAGQIVAPADAEFPVIKVYKYFDVTQENLAAEELTSAKIAFTVEDAWLSSNSATKEDVVLQRWNNNEWETYDPTYLGEDQGFHKFEASVPGFSSFVIGLREGAGAAVVEPGTGPEEQPGEPSAEGTKVLPIIIVLLVLVVVGAAVWWFVNKKK